jgi:hypothetical protein
MYVHENKVLRHSACRWPMFFALFLVTMLFATLVNAAGSDSLTQTPVITSDINQPVTASHMKHEMKISARLCEKPDCKTTADCEQACSVHGSCTHSVFVESTRLLHAVSPPGARCFSVFNKLSYISSEPKSLFRPPIS